MGIVSSAFKFIWGCLKMLPCTIKEMISAVYNYNENRKWGRFSIACLLALLITIVSGIVGIIAFHVSGGEVESFHTAMKTMSFDQAVDVSFDKEAVEFMSSGVLATIIVVLAIYMIISAVIDCFKDSTVKAIIATVLLVIGIVTGIMNIVPVAGVAIIAAMVLAYFAFRNSVGGKEILLAIFSLVFHFGLMPLIMLCAQNPLNGIQVVLYGVLTLIISVVAIVFVGGMVGAGLSGSSDTSSSSSSEPDYAAEAQARKRKKLQEEIEMYERKNNESGKCIREHAKESFGYGHIDPKVCRRDIEKRNKYIEMNKKELAKLG